MLRSCYCWHQQCKETSRTPLLYTMLIIGWDIVLLRSITKRKNRQHTFLTTRNVSIGTMAQNTTSNLDKQSGLHLLSVWDSDCFNRRKHLGNTCWGISTVTEFDHRRVDWCSLLPSPAFGLWPLWLQTIRKPVCISRNLHSLKLFLWSCSVTAAKNKSLPT